MTIYLEKRHLFDIQIMCTIHVSYLFIFITTGCQTNFLGIWFFSIRGNKMNLITLNNTNMRCTVYI